MYFLIKVRNTGRWVQPVPQVNYCSIHIKITPSLLTLFPDAPLVPIFNHRFTNSVLLPITTNPYPQFPLGTNFLPQVKNFVLLRIYLTVHCLLRGKQCWTNSLPQQALSNS